MIEDRILLLRFKHGSSKALQDIYLKYRGYLLTLATALVNDVNIAEDIVHDFFVSFAQSADRLKLAGSLKWYLATCVTNRVRDRVRSSKRGPVGLGDIDSVDTYQKSPIASAICNEQMQLLSFALEQLPYEQREVIVLHTTGQMKFKAIARLQDISIKTVQSRYRYGLDKLRVILNNEVKK